MMHAMTLSADAPVLGRTTVVPIAPVPLFEISTYRPSRRSRPLAIATALALTLLLLGGLMFMNAGRHHHQQPQQRLMVFAVDLLPPPPKAPPPPAAPPQRQTPVIDMTRPAPVVTLPHQVTAPPLPATPPPAQIAPEPVAKPVAPIVTAPAPAPVTTVDLAEKLISVRKPTYPMREKQAHIEGTVQLLVVVATTGRVQDISISKSSGSSALDQAALEAVRHWRWSPPIANGQPAIARGIIPITFNLT